VLGADRVGAGEVGDGARHPQHTIVPAGGEAEALDGRGEQALDLG